MSSVFSKNSIMSGCVDFFCLACETQLRSDEDAILHIAKPIHKKNLDGTSFLDKFKEDRVRKVKKGYFCEYCNLFMRTAAKVGPHIAEPKHADNKAARALRREGNGVLAFENVFISENAWHGLVDDTCAVCDAEFDNAQIHKTDTWHALNLVLIEIELADNNVYRKVDESTFQCLTCNLVCALNKMNTHFKGAEHKTLYEQCCESAKIEPNEEQETPKKIEEDKTKQSPGKEAKKVITQEKEKKPEVEQKTVEKQAAKDNKSIKSPEKESAKDKAKKTEKETAKEESPKKSNEGDKGAKNSGKGAKDALGKTDKDICKALGAVDYITRDVCGKQWCILCDWSMDDGAVAAHIRSRHHQTILKMHKERAEKNQGNDEPETNGDDQSDDKSRIADSANEFQKNDIKLDLVGGSAYCRKCSKSIDFDYDQITNHIDEHKKKPEAKPPKEVKPFPTGSEQKSPTALFTTPVHKNDVKHKHEKERDSRASSVASNREEVEAEAFAKQHNLTYTRDKNNAFCRVCVSKIPATVKNMREHINGMSHKNKLAGTTVKSTVKAPTMIPSNVFIDSVITIENMFSKDIVINEKYVVNILSFLMITKIGAKLRCQACETNLAVSQIDAHKSTNKHEKIMNNALVASSVESEFIREIRPNLYHCGFCNQLEATWATMESHLQSSAHREAKTAASWRMAEYVPMIAQHKARQRMEFALFARMFMGQMFGDD